MNVHFSFGVGFELGMKIKEVADTHSEKSQKHRFPELLEIYRGRMNIKE